MFGRTSQRVRDPIMMAFVTDEGELAICTNVEAVQDGRTVGMIIATVARQMAVALADGGKAASADATLEEIKDGFREELENPRPGSAHTGHEEQGK